MSIGYIRKWTDADAPTLTSAAWGNFAKWLKTILVDGYGSTPGLGWTNPFTSPDGNTIVFRNSTTLGTGTFFRVGNSNISGNYIYDPEVSAFESMSDYNTGLSRCPTLGTMLYWLFATGVGSNPIQWMVIGDSLSAWILVRPYTYNSSDITGNGKSWYVYFVGDYIPLDISNKNNFLLTGSPTIGSTWGYFGRLNDSSVGKYWIMRDSSFNNGSFLATLHSGINEETAYIGFTPTVTSSINPTTHFSVPYLKDASGIILGQIPGLRNPVKKAGNNGVADENLQDIFVNLPDRTLNILRYRAYQDAYSMLPSVCLISGEGFRDVL